MKTCRKGLHQYPDNERRCPECDVIRSREYARRPEVKAARKAREAAKKLARPSKVKPQFKTCRKGLHQYPSELARCPECRYASNHTPKRLAAQQKRNTSDEAKVWQKSYRQSPKGRATKKAWKEGMGKGYDQKPERVERRRAYEKSERGKEMRRRNPNTKKRRTLIGSQRTKIAINGDLTIEQWDERIIDFEHKCAYCSVQCLTKDDGVDIYHSHYLTMDHIVPLVKNGEPCGENTLDNVVPACKHCNMSKSNKDVWEWIEKKGLIPGSKLLAILIKATKKNE